MHPSTSKDNHTTTAHTSVSFQPRPSDLDAATVLKRVGNKHQKRRQDPRELLLFSDPLDGTSSDEQSFDEDDMCGSDPDVETISLGFRSKDQKQPLNVPVVRHMRLAVLVQDH
jgi:hypothetical protein